MSAVEPGRVLVVDDDRHVSGFCRRVLEGLGLTVETAASAEEAWERMLAGRFDFVLSDIAMSGARAGVILAEEVKNRWPETDVVMMTGQPALDTALTSLKTGVFDYLIKPFPSQQLEAVARRLLERRRLTRELEREKHLRSELEAAYAELQKVERLKAALLSRVSHELRTPITVARMAAGLLEGEVPGAAGKAVLVKLSSAIDNMQAAVEDLLLYALSKNERFPLNKAEVDLRLLLERVIEAQRPLCERRRLRVEFSSPGRDGTILADGPLLHDAFTRLLLNAIHFNKRGGRIEVSLAHGADDVSVAFADTGIGVALDQRESIFDGLYQAAEHLTRQVGGLGVGLAVVRRIVEAHGGEVSVGDRQGGGAVFTVRLPDQKAASLSAPGAGRTSGEGA